LAENKTPESAGPNPDQPKSLGDEIMEILTQKCTNPGEAFVLLQQLTVFVWDQYKIDWNQEKGGEAGSTRKARYMDYVSNLLDNLKQNNALMQKID
jgi:hypothetical protein